MPTRLKLREQIVLRGPTKTMGPPLEPTQFRTERSMDEIGGRKETRQFGTMEADGKSVMQIRNRLLQVNSPLGTMMVVLRT